MSTQDLLAKIGQSTEETEFYTPMPPGYRKGHHKYVVVVGTVISGLGKGIFASSLAKLMQDKGLRVAPIKMEGYYNVDSGTLNPYRHGEVFVLDDGMETDMDLGTYERLLDQDLSAANFTTNGQIMSSVLKKEREGSYLGRDVQAIPHVTGEIKLRLRELAVKSNADVVFVEVGGTVGDYETMHYLEACRQLAFEEGEGAVVFVALTYILEPNAVGEQKSKAAQLGIKRLMEVGIMPHIIACRATREVREKVREKISMYTNVPMRRVVSMHDLDSIYLIPDALRDVGIDREVLTLLDLHERVNQRHEDQARLRWRWFVDRIGVNKKSVTLAVTGKYVALRDAYASIIKAAEHCSVHLGVDVQLRWLDTTMIDADNVAKRLADVQGIIVPGGFGIRGTEGKIECIRYARENKMPYLGLCLGFQMAVIEFARNVCGLKEANSTEFETNCKHPVIDILPEQKKIEGLGGNMRLGGKDIELKQGSLVSKLFDNARMTRLRFRHRYEVDPTYIKQLEDKGMIFSGKHPTQPIMQVLELPQSMHPYFVGTQAHPELTSRPLRPSPLFMGFVKAAAEFANRHAGGSSSPSQSRKPEPQPV
ncbi:CTP synthase [Humisphaera borealis]|uniref:CTP synthase n=1 Tax=Humisphaera borealis TaxID=2807512 RepID=A0A7M2WU75_9BACT|nr:CTP synthase [Humisphaera borealis]QOV89077.1 CTP synthase [Humisphaera borealis]